MGKSHKKVRNDRINAIRKQYDAFLDEDRKRRERNEYILGQLDKMRSTTALVPITPKVKYHNLEHNPSEIYMRPNNLRTNAQMRNTYVSYLETENVKSDFLNTPAEELRILKEISKKYILIPKRMKAIENNFIYTEDINDADWKTKYNILDELKEQEKEGKSDPANNEYNDNNYVQKRSNLSMNSNKSEAEPPNMGKNSNNKDTMPKTEKNDELTSVGTLGDDILIEQNKITKQVNFNVSELNNQDNKESQIHNMQNISNDQTQSSYNIMQEKINNPQQEDITEKEKYNTESNEKELNSQISVMSNLDDSIIQENVIASDCNISKADPTNIYVAQENMKEDMTHDGISDQIISGGNPQEPGKETEDVHLDQNTYDQKDAREIQDLTSTERVEIYNDVDPQGQTVTNETILKQPEDYDPTQNTIPVDIDTIQKTEHLEHESEINAFEAEQKEMFYSEQAQGDEYGYNQGEDNTEYPESYEQKYQYAYYESVQQEQAYEANINEHEESTERYDPHYNEQYKGSYENQQPEINAGYDNTNAYEQQQEFQDDNQQAENVANYENQQENVHLYQQENVNNINEIQDVLPQDDQIYDQQLYAEQAGTLEHIEQQLVTEEGYIESPSEIANDIQRDMNGQVENVIESITPEQPVLDPKLS